MQLVRAGDARAFEIVFDRHSGAAFSLAYRMCGRQAMAEDIVQEAFVSLWRSGARYDATRGSVRTWVLSVVRNRAIDAFRRESAKGSRDVSEEGIAERMAAPELTDAEVERRDEARQVRKALVEPPARPAPGDRAGVLRRLHAQSDRGHARVAERYREGADAPRPHEDATCARRQSRGDGVTVEAMPGKHDCGADAAAYVLGALEPEEAEAFSRHLATCVVCRDEVAAFQHTANAPGDGAAPASRPARTQAPRDASRARDHATLRRRLGSAAPAARGGLARTVRGPAGAFAAVAAFAVVVVVIGAIIVGSNGSSGTRDDHRGRHRIARNSPAERKRRTRPAGHAQLPSTGHGPHL